MLTFNDLLALEGSTQRRCVSSDTKTAGWRRGVCTGRLAELVPGQSKKDLNSV